MPSCGIAEGGAAGCPIAAGRTGEDLLAGALPARSPRDRTGALRAEGELAARRYPVRYGWTVLE